MHRASNAVRRRLDSLVWALLPGICILCDARTDAAADLCEACRVSLPIIERPAAAARCRCTNTDDARLRRVPATPAAVRSNGRCAALRRTRHADDPQAEIPRQPHRRARARRSARRVVSATNIETTRRRRVSSIPVPLSRQPSAAARAQSGGAARAMGSAARSNHDVSIDYRSCRRIRDTPPQTGLTRAATTAQSRRTRSA